MNPFMINRFGLCAVLLTVFSLHTNAQATGSAVDLGLSVYWASCNVGANEPEGIGGYYAWGETEEKDRYSDNYAYCYSETSFIDIGADISGTQYDVARVKWEGSWRMPTIEEVKELINNCSWTWTTQNGVNGVLVTGPNSNSIFLPAGGRKYGTKGLRDFGEYGCYWSSSLDSSDGTSAYAKLLLFFEDGQDWNDDRNRFNGMLIRPVTNDPTGIRSIINNEEPIKSIYNLSGQRLNSPQKGVNIINGKKVNRPGDGSE